VPHIPQADSTRTCPGCGRTLGTFSMTFRERTRYFWHTCDCESAAHAHAQRQMEIDHERYCQQILEGTVSDTSLALAAAQGMSFDTFHAGALRQNPLPQVLVWRDAILKYGDYARYRDPDSPPAALYFYSPMRGCGKTHLASALALDIRERGKRTIMHEASIWMRSVWGAALEDQPGLLRLSGERAFLVVLDDIGQTSPRTSADFWATWFNLRYARGGWTIITSNFTQAELLNNGIINESTYSRLQHMTRGEIIPFIGTDRRNPGTGGGD